jgi:hypothetical protein
MAVNPMGIFNVFSRRRDAYRALAETEDGKVVLADLAVLLGARPVSPLVTPNDPISTAAAAARMEVWNHIMGQIGMSEATVRQVADTYIAAAKQQEQADYE